MGTPARELRFCRLLKPLIACVLISMPAITAAAHAEEINLYSTRDPALVTPVMAAFTAATRIKVNLTYIENNLVARVAAEGAASPADVLMTIGLDKTSQFVRYDLTQPIRSSLLLAAIPPQLRDREAQWIGLSVRPRVVMVRADAVLDKITYEDLADSKWRGKLCMRSPSHQNNVALISAFLLHRGAETTETWLKSVKANLAHAPRGKDNDVIRDIAQGTCEIGIANTVALAQLRDGREGVEWSEWARKVKAVPTTFANGGSHVNLTGAALAKHAPHPEAALKFLEFLITRDAQTLYAAAELEYPVVADATAAPIVAEIGSFPIDTLPIDRIAANQQVAKALIVKAGFDD